MTEKQVRNKIISLGLCYLGCNEKAGTHKDIIDLYNLYKPLPRGYRVKYTDEWCATFISALAISLNYTDIIPVECSCEKQIILWKQLGRWQEKDSYIPSMGDIIYYDWDDNGKGDCTGNSDHVGIVISVLANKITVLEGNKGEAVAKRVIELNGKYIRGYGLPNYSKKASIKTTGGLTIEAVAQEVIAGKWGTGIHRKVKLESEGYSYSEVQAAVNAILKGKKAIPTVTKTIAAIAQEVIQGHWGNGDERKRRLEAAGYDYQSVQKWVNKLL